MQRAAAIGRPPGRTLGHMSAGRRSRLVIAITAVVLVVALVAGAWFVLRDDSKMTRYEAVDPTRSQIETDVQAPPVLRDRVTTTSAGTTAPTTTAMPPGLWVSPTGNDKNNGSAQAPFRSLRYALSALRPGDTLYVADGEYQEALDTDSQFRLQNLNGSPDTWTVIAAAPGARPRLVGGEWATFKIEKSSYIEVRGLETIGTADVDNKPTAGIEIRDSHHIRVIGNYVRNGGGGGVGAIQSNHIDVIGNSISGMGKWNPYQTSGISMFEMRNIGGPAGPDGVTARIIGNVVFGTENITLPYYGGAEVTDGNCIIVDSTDPDVYKGVTYIANNVCSNNGGRGIHVFQAGNVVAVNNTMFHNTQTSVLRDVGGELSAVAASNVTFRNNLVMARDNRKAAHVHKSSNVVFEHNLFATAISTDVGGKGNKVVSDVGVRNPDGGDFELLPKSPAIDAGSTDGAPADDVRGTDRTGKPDIGAFEAAS
jgi:parallel beta-helix repeat protein